MKKAFSLLTITLLLFATPLSTLAATTSTKGDFDNDGIITVADALSALRIAAKLVSETSEAITIGDYDSDGRITVSDALSILRIAAKLTQNQDHTHSYIATVINPTCSSEGYTEHKCNCGDVYYTDYTQQIPHKFINYCCRDCGFVDNSHPYEGFKQWIRMNGKADGDYIDIKVRENNVITSFSLNTKKDTLLLYSYDTYGTISDYSDDIYCSIDLYKSSGFYEYGFFYGEGNNEIYISGSINPSTFNPNTTSLPYRTYSGNTRVKTQMLEIARLSLLINFHFFEVYLEQNVNGLNITDFGFLYSFK